MWCLESFKSKFDQIVKGVRYRELARYFPKQDDKIMRSSSFTTSINKGMYIFGDTEKEILLEISISWAILPIRRNKRQNTKVANLVGHTERGTVFNYQYE